MDGAINRIVDIIRKHMNDGWISVEKYGLPKEEGIYDLTIINGRGEYVSVRWEFLSGVHLSGQQHYVDGVHYWADNYRGDPINEFLSKRVIAWRKKPEPYRPERSEKKKRRIAMQNKTCETCIDNDFGLCDRLGVLVENDDSCEKHREKTVERYEREGDQRPEKKAMR